MNIKTPFLPYNPKVKETSEEPEISQVKVYAQMQNPNSDCDEIANLPEVNTVLRNTTYRLNHFIRSKKKRLFRLNKLDREIDNTIVKKIMDSARLYGFVSNVEIIPAHEVVKEIPAAQFIDVKNGDLVTADEVTVNDYMIVDGKQRVEAYFRLDAEAGMSDKSFRYDLLVSVIKIPANLSIEVYMNVINNIRKLWNTHAKFGYAEAMVGDEYSGLHHAQDLVRKYNLSIRYATALMQFRDEFKPSMLTNFMEGGELHSFLKSKPQNVERGLKLFQSLLVGFHNYPKLLKNMILLRFVIEVYNDTEDDNKSQIVDDLCSFFQSLTVSDVEYISNATNKETKQGNIRVLWEDFTSKCINEPDFSVTVQKQIEDNKKSLAEKEKKSPEEVAHQVALARKKSRRTKGEKKSSTFSPVTNIPEIKPFHGNALYQPSGKAAEYSSWAVNFYNGCENDCDYCYCKKGVLGRLWANEPQLKKCFKDEEDALQAFQKELMENHGKVSEHGILFSFTTDPMLPKTWGMTFEALEFAVSHNVPVKILTKRTDWMEEFDIRKLEGLYNKHKDKIAFGFTLTGRDDLEPNASPNANRIEAMKKLHAQGFKTFASIEPVVIPQKSIEMIEATKDCCDIFKVGLMSGKKDYDLNELNNLFNYLKGLTGNRIYLKDSFAKNLFINRDNLPEHFVNSDFNIFKNQ